MPPTAKSLRHETPSPYGARGTYHHGNLRVACVEAGVRLVEEDGPDAVTIRGVARLAGVSHTAPLHHFSDRHELLDAVADRGFELLLESLDESLARATSPTEALRAYGMGYVDHAVEHPGLFALMFRPDANLQGSTAYRRLMDLTAAAQSAGVIPGRDSDALSLLLWATIHGLANLYGFGHLTSGQVTGPPADHRSATGAVLDQLLRALRAAARRAEASR